MKKRISLAIFVVVFGAGVGLGVYIRNQTLNPRASFPGVAERIFSFFVQQGEKEDDDLLYYDTGLADFIVNGSVKTKVAVVGTVDKITKQPDGDYHVIIRDPTGLLFLVTEFIPQIQLPLPNAGDHVKIWGIVRFDVLHNWWELHPTIGWERQ